jgi:proton-dependent oligopeptide transporter, POT family
MNAEQQLKQPKVFYLAVFTSALERFGFYVLSFLMVLYLKSEFSLSDTNAYMLFGVFTGLVYVAPALGGYLADHVFGIRRCMIVGLFLEAIGLALLAAGGKPLIYLALTCLILGVGLFKIGPTDLMARAYKEKDPRIDSGFTIYYMLMNVGGLLAPVIGSIVQQFYGWQTAFFAAMIGPLLSLCFYFLLRKSAANVDTIVGQQKMVVAKKIYFILGIVIATLLCWFLVSHAKIADIFFFVATAAIILYFVVEMFKGTKEEALKIVACLYLIFIGFVFYIYYFQAYTSWELFIDRSVNRHLFGFTIPTASFLSLDPIWIIILSPLLAYMYKFFAAKGKDLAVTTKFSIGLLIISLCFLLLTLSAQFHNAQFQVSGYWLVFAFLLYALAEMLIGALGVAMITHIAPKKLYGVMMGAWYLIAMGLSGSTSGLFASMASVPENVTDPAQILHIYASAFLKLGLGGIIFTVIAFSLSPYIKKIAQLS